MLIPYTTICPECWKEPSKADADAQERLSLDTETQKYVCAAGHSFDQLPGLEAEVSKGGEPKGGNMETTESELVSAQRQSAEEPSQPASPSDAPLQEPPFNLAPTPELPKDVMAAAQEMADKIDRATGTRPDIMGLSVPRADAITDIAEAPSKGAAPFAGMFGVAEGTSLKLQNGDVLVCIRIPEVHASVLQACTDEHPAKITFGEYVQRAINFALDQDWLRNAGN